MANSYIEYTSGLTATTYSVPFNVLSITDVNVKGYNGTTWSDLTVSSRDAAAKTITLSGAPSAFQKIRVWRNTGTTQLVDFQNGSRLSESDLDTAYQQGLFVAQEVSENASTGALAVGETGAQGATGAAGVDGADGADGADGISTAPFNPVAVTGATPSLDVGSYNFFNQGALTANTTVSFSNVPTNARWSYIFKGAVTGGWNIPLLETLSAYAEQKTGVAYREGLFFKPDGTAMYTSDDSGGSARVQQFALSTAWDVSTATAGSTYAPTENGRADGIFIKPDGLSLFVAANTSVHEYSLSTAWDVSTASYASKNKNLSSEVGSNSAKGVHFKADGTKMLIADGQGNRIWQYTLSTAWDISTASAAGSFNTSGETSEIHSVVFKTDGTRMYVLNQGPKKVVEYDLSTAFNVTSASYNNVFFDNELDATPAEIFFRADGEKLFVIGKSSSTVRAYNPVTLATITLPSSISNLPTTNLALQTIMYDFFTMDGGTTVTLLSEETI